MLDTSRLSRAECADKAFDFITDQIAFSVEGASSIKEIYRR